MFGPQLGLIVKIGGIGILTTVIESTLTSANKTEWIMFIKLAAIVVGFTLVLNEVGMLLNTVQTMFMLK